MAESSNGAPWHCVSYEDALVKLLLEFYAVEKLAEHFDGIGVEFDFAFDPLGRLLDLLGVPVDNTVETNACEIANSTGEWPDNSFCRDTYYQEALEYRDEPRQFIRDVLKEVDEWVAAGRVLKRPKA